MSKPPAAPTLRLAPGSDTGLSHSDDITNDTSPVFVGTAPPGSLVTLTDPVGSLNLSTQADANGNFRITAAGLAPGPHALSVVIADAAGNFIVRSATLNVDVETSATAAATASDVPANVTSLTFAVHFDQPVSTISATSFVLATTGTAYGNVETVAGSGEDYTVTVAGLGGDGTVGLAFSAYTPTDVAGNQVALTTSVGHVVADTTTDTALDVSSDSAGAQGTGFAPSISGDGRYVAFISNDGDLVPNGSASAGVTNIYVKDLKTGQIAQVTAGNSDINNVQISADGTTVAFSSTAFNLVAGGTAAGQLNLYVATLESSVPVPGISPFGRLSLVPGSVKLIGTLDDESGTSPGFALSGDGSTLAYQNDASTPIDYIVNLKSGTQTQFAAKGLVSSISSDGGEIAYTQSVAVPGTGGEPDDQYFGGVTPPDYVQDAMVYNVATGSTTVIDGSGLLPNTTPPTGPGQTATYLTDYPILSGDGSTLVFQLLRGSSEDALFSVELANPAIFSPISPGASTADGGTDNDYNQSVSVDGKLVAYTDHDPVNGLETVLYSAATHSTTVLGPGEQGSLSPEGNAIAETDLEVSSTTTPVADEDVFGVSVSVDPVNGTDEIDATTLKLAQSLGLVVTGTTNAPEGSSLVLSVVLTDGSSLSSSTGSVGDDGRWTATIPGSVLNIIRNTNPFIAEGGPFFLVARVVNAQGAAQAERVASIDTVAPDAPTAPVLDQGSNTGSDGVHTNDTTPTLDGLAEAGATVFLYDVSGGGQTRLATATADENGVYTLTSSPLADGAHLLAVQAQDMAGNDSPLSSTATITVDTVAPLKPSTPALAPGQDTAALVEDTVSIATPVLTGSTEPNATITLYDGNTAIGTVKAGSDGSYSIKSPLLANGDHSLVVTATDLAGNTGPASDPLDLTIDTVAPGAPLLAGVNGQTLSDGGLSPSFTVTGTAAAQTTVILEVDGAAVDADSADTRASGAYTISVAGLSPGVHTLSVTATDGAGNVSQPSAATTVTISSLSAGVPGPNAINGVLLDGPIAGATVFADANGNGVQDPGEAEAVTTVSGQFTLNSPSGELVAAGGTDSETGLATPGALTAPAGSIVIDPLTTLLDAYAAAMGQTPQAAQPALLAILGLDPATDLTQTDPEAAAASGDPSLLIASAQVMDSAVVYAELVAAQTGVSTAKAFAASFTALAQQAATGTLNLQDTATTLVNLATAAAAIADPGFVLANGIAQDAAIILDSGNYDLTTASGQTDPTAALTLVEAIERVEQGQAAPQLAAGSNDQASADQVAETYSDGLPDAVGAAESPVLAPPVLASGDDTGISAQDGLTSDATPTFTGTAPPGATVILAVQAVSQPGAYSIVGSGIADAGGHYAIAATLPAGRDDILALQATPGEVTVTGTGFYGTTDLTTAQVTEVTIGDFSDTKGTAAPPTIQQVEYTANSANTATATSLYLTGDGSYDIQAGAFYTVTANGAPVSAAAAQDSGSGYGILTTPLATGTYSLVVTETALDGETVQSKPTTVTVTAPGSLSVLTEAGGPVVGGSILGYEPELSANLLLSPEIHPNATTGASGAASIPTQSKVPVQGSSQLYETDEGGLQVQGGQDAVTGLILPVPLSAPPGASVITPATSLLNQADTDATSYPFPVTATDYAYENRRIDTALGLPTTVDLATADPLAMAEAGNATLFVKDLELLDTMTLLIPFTADGDAAYTSDPLYIIDQSLGVLKFDGFIGGNAPAITTKPISFTSAAQVLAWLTTYDSTPINGTRDTKYDASVLPAVASIIAASNAAIEAHAAAATSLADTISYAVAVERVALSTEEQALAALSIDYTGNLAAQQAGFATLQADYTGAGLAASVAATLAQTVQVTGFAPASASTGAARETFTISFSAPVSGVTAGDFTVSGDAGLAGEAVTAVTPVAGSDGAAYTVTVGTGVGDGTLTLGFTPNGLASAAGLPLATGTFAAPQSYSSPLGLYGEGATAQGLATGDFNGDGHMDVLLANDSADGVTLFLGQGDGSFVAEPAIYTSSSASGVRQVVTGDFNGDGKLDAVTLNSNYPYSDGGRTVSAMLGNGDGTFAGPVQTDVGPSALNMVAGDFNGDGKLDLAVSDGSSNNDYYGSVQLFYGDGDGTFTAGPTMNVGADLDVSETNADTMVAADLNGDGKPDLVIATSDGVAILLGNGHGGFTLATAPAVGFGESFDGLLIAVSDVNGDGIPDIVAVPQEIAGSETAAILLGNGDGTFKPSISVPLALPPGGSASNNSINGNFENTAVEIGDVTGDGKPDIVVENDETGVNSVVVAPGNGDGTFGPSYTDAAAINSGPFGYALVADVNGDGRPDLITSAASGSEAGSSVGSGISVSLGTAQTVLPASATVTVDRAAEAQPALNHVSGTGTLSASGTNYTLDLGRLSQGSSAAAVLALVNEAAAPADEFDGTFSAPAGSGFTVTGADLPAAIAAGQSDAGLTFVADTSTLGSQSETITFAPRDLTNDPGTTLSVPVDVAEGDPTSSTEASADANGADVALALAPITLTVTDDVVAAGALAAPTITGTLAGQAASDEASILPFAGVTVADANGGQTETVSVTQDTAANGTLTDPAAATDGSTLGAGGVLGFSGSAATVSTILQGLSFTPAPHQVAPGSSVATRFTIAVTDTAGQTASDANTMVVATAVDDAPVIGGIGAPESITLRQTAAPFSSVTLTDPDFGASLGATIVLSAAGTPTNADGMLSGSGLTLIGPGTYALAAASPAAEQAALRALVFTPASVAAAAGGTVSTTIRLTVSDGTQSASNDATVVTVAQTASTGQGAPAVTLRLADDTGRSATDGVTSDDALLGTTVAGDTVIISDATGVLGSAVCRRHRRLQLHAGRAG